MEILNSQKITRDVKKILARFKVKGKEIDHINFIMERFFHYAILLLMHGRTMCVPKFMKFDMVYYYFKSIPRKLKKSLYFSSKAFGYSFYVVASAKKMDYFGYTFRCSKPLMKTIADHNESDVIYKLLKK